MDGIEVLFLSQEDVKSCSPGAEETRQIMESLFCAHAEGKVVMPTKSLVKPLSNYKGHWNAMPAYVETAEGHAGGIKWLSSYLGNIEDYKIPNLIALIILNDPKTGFPIAIMDGTYITGLRTAAAVSAGALRLARPESSTVAMIGNSVQSRFQLEAIIDAFPIQRVLAFDINTNVMRKYVRDMSQKIGQSIEMANSWESAVKDADIVINATRTKEPFFEGEWCKPGVLIVSIGSMPELKSNVLEHINKVVVDEWEGCKHLGSLKPFYDAGALKEVYAEIGDVMAGRKPGRESDEEIILYVPMGMGSEDIATAQIVYKNAKELGLGNNLIL